MEQNAGVELPGALQGVAGDQCPVQEDFFNPVAAFTVLVTGTVFFCIFAYILLKWSFYPPGEKA